MKVRVFVTLRKQVLDPQGLAIKNALHSLGHQEIEQVRQGKLFEIEINEENLEQNKIEEKIQTICQKVLANEVIEDFRFEIVE